MTVEEAKTKVEEATGLKVEKIVDCVNFYFENFFNDRQEVS